MLSISFASNFGDIVFSQKEFEIFRNKMSNGQILGPFVATYPNGVKFRSEIKNGTIEKSGILEYLDGNKYEFKFGSEENFINGVFHGSYTFTNNGSIFTGEFTGEFNDKKLDGKFKVVNKNGNTYYGYIKYGVFDGKGKLTYKNKNEYEGEFKNGLFNGAGKFTTIYHVQDETVYKNVYEGIFCNGKFTGLVSKTCFSTEEKYDGTFVNVEFDEEGNICGGIYHGRGLLTYNDGHIYRGEFKNGVFDGFGVLCYSCGDVYEGEFKNGICEGFGKLTFANGQIIEGEFINGYCC